MKKPHIPSTMRTASVATDIERDAADIEHIAFRKIAWRILPILVISFLFNYIDRTNIAVAALTMNREVGLTNSQFGFGAGILFVGYCLFEVPSNLALYRFGARLWLSRILATWGLISAAMIFVSGVSSYYALRFLLGVAEAGFFPGVAYYLSNWFPAAYRSRVIAWFLVAIPASALIGSPLSAMLLQMDGIAGLAGWKWLFLAESLPCVLLGIALLKLLSERPQDASWLTAAEREAVIKCLQREQRVNPITTLKGVFSDPRVWLLGAIYLGFSIGSYGLQIWMPLIIKQSGFSNSISGLLSAIPYLFAVIFMIAWATYVDRHGRRLLHVVLTCVLGAGGLLIAFESGSFSLAFFGLIVSLVGVNAARAVFWAIPPKYLSGVASAAGLAFISSIGVAGGFIGPALVGWVKDATGSFNGGLLAMCGCLTVSAVLAAVLRLTVGKD